MWFRFQYSVVHKAMQVLPPINRKNCTIFCFFYMQKGLPKRQSDSVTTKQKIYLRSRMIIYLPR